MSVFFFGARANPIRPDMPDKWMLLSVALGVIAIAMTVAVTVMAVSQNKNNPVPTEGYAEDEYEPYDSEPDDYLSE